MTQRRLSSQQKNDVVVRYLDGENTVSLGLDYGISVSAICGILERRGISRRNRSEAQRKCSLNEYAFDNPTAEAIYWAGFIFADGSLFQNGGSPAITLKLSETDLGHVEKFRSFLESSHSIVCVKPRDTRIRFRGARPGFQYSVRSHRLVSRLEEFGWRPKLGSVACLEFAHSSDFWRGVIDGDGYLGVGSGKRTNLARLELVGGRPLLCQFLDFVGL